MNGQHATTSRRRFKNASLSRRRMIDRPQHLHSGHVEQRASDHGEGVGIELFVAIGDRPLPFSDAKPYGKFWSNTVRVAFEERDRGRIATYYSRWITDDGQVGPWSPPTSIPIQV